MNQITRPGAVTLNVQGNAPMTQIGGGAMFAPTSLQDVVSLAHLMASAGPGVPKHCRQNPGVCAAIIMQAARWGADPFAVALKSYVVNDIVAYEAQLVAAVLYSSGVLSDRFEISYEGTGADRVCIVQGTFQNGKTRVYRSPPIGSISPKNSPLWKTDPDRQHAYWSERAFARLYCPDVLLGIYTDDEIERHQGPDKAKDITPPDLSAKLAAKPQGGFSQEHIDAETGEITERAPFVSGALTLQPPSEEFTVTDFLAFMDAMAATETEEQVSETYVRAMEHGPLDEDRAIYSAVSRAHLARINGKREPEEVTVFLNELKAWVLA